MKLVKQLLNFYLNSSIHVALSVYALTYITLLEFGFSYEENVLNFVFYASVTGYNFVKYFGVAKFHHRRLANWLKAIQVFSFFAFILMCYYGLQLSLMTLMCIAGFGVVTFLYAIPFLPKELFLDQQNNLRSIGGLKIYLIGLVWMGVTVCLPIIENEYAVCTDVIITALQRYVYVLVLMLPFEIRDLQYDSLKLSTVPQKIGVKGTKLMGVILLFVFFVLEFFKDETHQIKILVLLMLSILTGVLVLLSSKKQNVYYASFWVEALPILWLILMLLFD
ncbi:hypothetical protein [Algibacter sp. L4_22]|uniref:hypothetical protein n=1 Tax=Algibacter sp. L4_22 TaxID=2942477 RepID=UPI00201B88C7|nr:hypothetical protein [Algibacter sp. L4_22]MCL5127596.1 hypothetical protein [Algibacter sp. L4_22]